MHNQFIFERGLNIKATKKLKTIKGGKIVIEQEFKIKMDKSKNFDYYALINEESESIFDESYM